MEIIVAIALIVLVIFLAVFLFASAVVSTFVWGPAVIVMLLTHWLYRMARANEAVEPSRLSELLRANCSGDSLSWSIIEHAITDHAKAGAGTTLTIIVGILVATIVTVMLSNDKNSIGWIIWVDVLSIIPIVYCAIHLHDRSAKSVRDAVNTIAQNAKRSVARLSEVSALDDQARKAADFLSIEWPHHLSAIRHFVDDNKAEILTNPEKLDALVEDALTKGREEMEGLRKCKIIFESVESAYKEAAREVNRSDRMNLMVELDDIYRYIRSPNLGEILLKANWQDYDDLMKELNRDLLRLREQACRPYEDNPPENGDSDVENSDGQMTLAVAYAILGVSTAATDDEIKSEFKKLSRVFHPDGHLVPDPARFQQIKKAYDFLRGNRAFV